MGVLRSPLLRAGYWMELNGVRVLEEDQRMADAETMMEVMEVSEEIEDAETKAEINSISEVNVQKIKEVEGKLSSLFESKDWESAKTLLERLQMLTRIQTRLDEWTGP